MGEHILTFSHLNDEENHYSEPKDKFPWKLEDKRPHKYVALRRRYIITDGKEFKHPHKWEEDRWRQEIYVDPHTHHKPRPIDELSEFSDAPPDDYQIDPETVKKNRSS